MTEENLKDEQAYLNEIQEARNTVGSTPPADVILGREPGEALDTFIAFLRHSSHIRRRRLHLGSLSELSELLQDACGIDLDAVIAFANDFLPDDPSGYAVVFECLILVFQPRIAVSYGEGILSKTHPELAVDDDGLLRNGQKGVIYKKEGVLYKSHWLPYDPWISRFNLEQQGGFIDALLEAYSREPQYRFGIALDQNLLLDKRMHADSLEKAYIRGPIGIRLEDLQDPNFPPQREPTLVEHQRVVFDPLRHYLPLDRIQVLWKWFRDQKNNHIIKEVEIEELPPIGADEYKENRFIPCRYIHSEWDVEEEGFRHFDGCINLYSITNFPKRARHGANFREVKADVHKKLFRYDANINLARWNDLVAKYFVGNELVIEFLGGEKDG